MQIVEQQIINCFSCNKELSRKYVKLGNKDTKDHYCRKCSEILDANIKKYKL